jgi:hypothetical protein
LAGRLALAASPEPSRASFHGDEREWGEEARRHPPPRPFSGAGPTDTHSHQSACSRLSTGTTPIAL